MNMGTLSLVTSIRGLRVIDVTWEPNPGHHTQYRAASSGNCGDPDMTTGQHVSMGGAIRVRIPPPKLTAVDNCGGVRTVVCW